MLKIFNLSFTLFVIISLSAYSQNKRLLTVYELSNKTRTFNYQETIDFSKKLDASSKHINYIELGRSADNHVIPLLVADKDGLACPKKIKKKGRLILMIIANIHAGEPDGLDAGFLLFRDIALKQKSELELLENVSIVFIPVLNPDGLNRFGKFNRINQNGPIETGWRSNSQNLNLNRDFIKAQAPETRHLHNFISTWKPDFYIDCHTTNGADYQYVVTYTIETYKGTDEHIAYWNKNVYLNNIKTKMEQDGFPMFEYVAFKDWFDHRKPLITYASSPNLSNGYFAALNRPGLLLETHMLKPYYQRVEASLLILKNTLIIMNNHKNSLKEAISKADNHTKSQEFRKNEFPIAFSLTDSLIEVDFLGFEYSVRKSELTGAEIFEYDQTKPVTHKLKKQNQIKASKLVTLPYAYVVPYTYKHLVDKLKNQGVEVFQSNFTGELAFEYITFSDVRFSETPMESCQRAFYTVKRSDTLAYITSNCFIIPIFQTQARIIAKSLEPESNASFVSWGFFNAIFERREYTEIYTMEKIAQKMIKENPELLVEFETLRETNPEFYNKPMNAVNWFYRKSPFYDSKHNVYPVKMVKSELDFQKLLKNKIQ